MEHALLWRTRTAKYSVMSKKRRIKALTVAARHFELDAETEREESERFGITYREHRAALARAKRAAVNAEVLRQMALELSTNHQEYGQ
jgi:hypothetical protein